MEFPEDAVCNLRLVRKNECLEHIVVVVVLIETIFVRRGENGPACSRIRRPTNSFDSGNLRESRVCLVRGLGMKFEGLGMKFWCSEEILCAYVRISVQVSFKVGRGRCF